MTGWANDYYLSNKTKIITFVSIDCGVLLDEDYIDQRRFTTDYVSANTDNIRGRQYQ